MFYTGVVFFKLFVVLIVLNGHLDMYLVLSSFLLVLKHSNQSVIRIFMEFLDRGKSIKRSLWLRSCCHNLQHLQPLY